VFLEILRNKGRFQDLISQMPVKVILNPKAGLLGAAAVGLRMSTTIQTIAQMREAVIPKYCDTQLQEKQS